MTRVLKAGDVVKLANDDHNWRVYAIMPTHSINESITSCSVVFYQEPTPEIVTDKDGKEWEIVGSAQSGTRQGFARLSGDFVK